MFPHEEAIRLINDQFWHDSILYEIRIVRTNSADRVEMLVELITDDIKWKSTRVDIIFDGCYFVGSAIYGGVDCISDGEMISGASATVESSCITQVYETWKKMNCSPANLLHFSMVLSSTGSTIDIICQSVAINSHGGTEMHSAPEPIFPAEGSV